MRLYHSLFIILFGLELLPGFGCWKQCQMSMSFGECMDVFLWDVYLGVEWRGHTEVHVLL